MAQQNGQPELDLSKILQTLASFAPASQTGSLSSFSSPESGAPSGSNPASLKQSEVASYHSSRPAQAAPALAGESDVPLRSTNRTPSVRDPRLQSVRPAPHPIDPATILEWRPALRFVNRLSMQNPSFGARILKLIKFQEQHVKEWEERRERLVAEQTAKKKMEENLRASVRIPGIVDALPPPRGDELNKEELAAYDKKVYRCFCDLYDSQSLELKRLGVPFFAVSESLIIDDTPGSSHGAVQGEAETDGASNKKVTKSQLLDLQRQMLKYLEDLYGE